MNLTRREIDVLIGWAAGFRNRELAYEWNVSFKTVSRYGTNARRKLNARTNLQAISRAYELGILQIERDEP